MKIMKLLSMRRVSCRRPCWEEEPLYSFPLSLLSFKVYFNSSKTLLLFIGMILAFVSCNKEPIPKYGGNAHSFYIYKIKDTAYFNYVPVGVRVEDGKVSKITSMPDTSFPRYRKNKPLLLANSYYYEGPKKNSQQGSFIWLGKDMAIVDVKLTEPIIFNSDTMLNHIISHDLFNEFFESYTDSAQITSSTTFEHDTALLNSWIRNRELAKYMKRLK